VTVNIQIAKAKNMRKQFFALESAPQPTAPVRMLSLEEEMIVVDEAAQDEANIERDLSESERVIEVSDALEDVAVVADGIECATPGEVALIDTASQMAVAGTDLDPEEVVPAMESYLGKRISTETIRETARTIWENIQAFLTKVWNNIVAYFRVGAVVPMLEKRIESMEKKIKELGKLKEGAAPIKLKSSFLAIETKVGDASVVKNGAELKKALATNVEAATFVFGEAADKTAANGEALAKVIEKFTPETHAQVMQELLAEFGKLTFPKPPGAKGTTKDQNGNESFAGSHLLGGGWLQLDVYVPKDGTSPLGALERFRKSGLSFGGNSFEKAPTEVEFAVLSESDMQSLIKDAKDLLKQLKDFHAGARLDKLKKAGDSLKAASKKAAGEIAKIKQEDKGQAAIINDYRAAINLNVAFTRWVQSPALPFYGKCISTVKAVMHAIGSSMAQYESKDAKPAGEKGKE
jgi:hypothetical protein